MGGKSARRSTLTNTETRGNFEEVTNMSTANFRSMEYGLPMVIGGIYDSDFVESLKREHFIEFEEEMTDKEINAELEFYAEEALNEAEEMVENFNDSLEYFNVEVISGYYYGFQFYVSGKYFDNYAEEMNNEDAHYYFDKCRSQAVRAAESELRRISKWLRKIQKQYGYDMIECIGRFSNGEALYRKVG
jgi:hypothetical protein